MIEIRLDIDTNTMREKLQEAVGLASMPFEGLPNTAETRKLLQASVGKATRKALAKALLKCPLDKIRIGKKELMEVLANNYGTAFEKP